MLLASDNLHLCEPRIPVGISAEAWTQAPSAKVRRYIEQSVAQNTLKAYDSDLRHFLDWGGAIPARPEMVSEYIADHAEQHATATLTRGARISGRARRSATR